MALWKHVQVLGENFTTQLSCLWFQRYPQGQWIHYRFLNFFFFFCLVPMLNNWFFMNQHDYIGWSSCCWIFLIFPTLKKKWCLVYRSNNRILCYLHIKLNTFDLWKQCCLSVSCLVEWWFISSSVLSCLDHNLWKGSFSLYLISGTYGLSLGVYWLDSQRCYLGLELSDLLSGTFILWKNSVD